MLLTLGAGKAASQGAVNYGGWKTVNSEGWEAGNSEG